MVPSQSRLPLRRASRPTGRVSPTIAVAALAPLVVHQSVVVGISGGDYGIRGFLAAYDVVTGKQQWRFDTIPGPGEFGHESWGNDAWRKGGGATWVTGSYDPTTDLLYWGVGNPAPDFDGDVRPGDNLFTDSVVALRASAPASSRGISSSPRTMTTTGMQDKLRFLPTLRSKVSLARRSSGPTGTGSTMSLTGSPKYHLLGCPLSRPIGQRAPLRPDGRS